MTTHNHHHHSSHRYRTDLTLLAEIVNNLGCLSYMCGEMKNAIEYFHESYQLLTELLHQSTYVGLKFSCQTLSLNLSVCRANMGLVALANHNIPNSIMDFEAAAQVQLQ